MSSAGAFVDSVVDLVLDGSKDVARNCQLDEITIGLDGRKRCQRIYMYTRGGTYDEQKDGSATLQDLKATQIELTGLPKTEAYIVVGVVLAQDPKKYVGKGSNRPEGSAINHSKENNMLRVVVQETPTIKASIKYFVAVNRSDSGIYETRLTKADQIFFFSEVWDRIANFEASTVKQRRTDLGTSCKWICAIDKTFA